MIGVLGILLAAKERSLLPKVRPVVDALLRNRFRITPQLYDWLLAEAGEGRLPR